MGFGAAGMIAFGGPLGLVGGAVLAGELLNGGDEQLANNLDALDDWLNNQMDAIGGALANGLNNNLSEAGHIWGGAGGIADQFGGSRRPVDPLIIDLDGNGIQLISLQDSTVNFDMNRDGFAERTAWVGAGDGILVIDRNHDGMINDSSELFGNESETGFAALSQMDANHDGRIDAADAGFANIRVWIDVDHDGMTDAGELKTLSTLGITALNADPQTTNFFVEGNLISELGTYLKSDGTTGSMGDAWFQVNTLLSRFDPRSTFSSDYTLSWESLLLPQLRGYGVVPDLYVAMSRDSGLLDMVRQLDALDLAHVDEIKARVESILIRWAGVDTLDPSSRGGFIDARHLATLESFLGQAYTFNDGNPNPNARSALILDQAWDLLVRQTEVNLLAQTGLGGALDGINYDIVKDDVEVGGALAIVIDRVASLAPTDHFQALDFWTSIIPILNEFQPKSDLSDSVYGAALNTALAPSGWNGYAEGFRAGPIVGSAAADILSGTQHQDIIIGGTGNDRLYGGDGGDLYILDPGFGDDTVLSWSSSDAVDTLLLGAGITKSAVHLNRVGNDLVISIAGTTDQITVSSHFYDPSWQVETLKFADGTTWSLTGALNIVGDNAANNLDGTPNADTMQGLGGNDDIYGHEGNDTIYGGGGNDHLSGNAGNDKLSDSAGNDILSGGDGNDSLEGGPGNDTLYGDAGNDSYVFKPGFGQDVIGENWTGSTDTISLGTGITPAQVLLNRVGNDLVISIAGTTDRITVSSHFYDPSWQVETLKFADGTRWSLTGALNIVGDNAANNLDGTPNADTMQGLGGNDDIYGHEGNDTIYGGNDNDYLHGQAGNDTLSGDNGNDILFGGDGNDSLEGGPGNDTLYGDAGNDRFVFTNAAHTAVGASHDIIPSFDNIGSATGDLLDLSGIDASAGALGDQAFIFIGTAAFVAGQAGRVHVVNDGSNSLVQGEVTGDGNADFEILVQNAVASSWVVSDFIL